MIRKLTLITILYCCITWLAAVLAQNSPGVPAYPTALDTGVSLPASVNNASTLLLRQIGPGDTTIYVQNISAFPASGHITIQQSKSAASEIVFYASKSGNSFNGCVRGQDGTAATSHLIGEIVDARVIAQDFNGLRTVLFAVEQKLGIGAGQPGSGLILGGGPNGSSAWRALLSADITVALGYAPVNRAGDSLTGALIAAADPTVALGLATKQYVDARAGVTLFNTRAGAVTLLSGDISGALGYVPQSPLTFQGAIQQNLGIVTCPTCEVQSNKNIAQGYAGLTSAGKLPVSIGQEVWSITDLTEYTGSSGTGGIAIRATITSPSVNDVLTWSGTNWINQPAPGGGSSGYTTIQNQGSGLTARTAFDIVGAALVASDDAPNTRTLITLSQSPVGSASVVGIGRLISNGTGISGGGDLSADRTLSVVADSVNEQIQILNQSNSLVGTRHAIRFFDLNALTWTLADSAGFNELQVTPVLATSPASASTLVGTGRQILVNTPLNISGNDLSADRTIGIGNFTGIGGANQIVGVSSSAGVWEYKTLSGTTNQIILTQGPGTLGFSLPQNIDTGAAVTFASLNLTGLTGFVIGSGTAISGTTSFNVFFSSATNKPGFRFLSTGTGTGKLQFSNDGLAWNDFSSITAITTLNGLTASSQTLAQGTGITIVSATSTHTFSINQAAALTWSALETFGAGVTVSAGNLTFGTTGQRITGDFSNATDSNRLLFQNSTVNGSSIVGIIPNGTATRGALKLYSSSDPNNASVLNQFVDSVTAASVINSTHQGTGTNQPIQFQIGGTTSLVINADLSVSWGGNTIVNTSGLVPFASMSGAAGALYVATANGTALTTSTSTDITPTTGQGSRTLPANFLTAGRTVKIRAAGVFSANASVGGLVGVNFTGIKLGSTAIQTTSFGPQYNSTNIANGEQWYAVAYITCRTAGASGTVHVERWDTFCSDGGTGQMITWMSTSQNSGTVTIDTTVSQQIGFFWSNASGMSNIQVTQYSIETMN
jgi:hypothetical protein